MLKHSILCYFDENIEFVLNCSYKTHSNELYICFNNIFEENFHHVQKIKNEEFYILLYKKKYIQIKICYEFIDIFVHLLGILLY